MAVHPSRAAVHPLQAAVLRDGLASSKTRDDVAAEGLNEALSIPGRSVPTLDTDGVGWVVVLRGREPGNFLVFRIRMLPECLCCNVFKPFSPQKTI